ncbi:MAG: acetyl-CoA carboxylase biotin carboxylase subunit [Spirochaetaceae bacterium]|jgi:acetyl-CoA carboxylase biotin carboxylase subunit|nr:acetyl-CoA carboxylase biotin carboxylase subunit [Spirochaetaceae bacterium]
MIKKLLIANRGEIAVRIIRACKEMGIETATVYSTADKDSLHVKMADCAVCIGPPPSAKSYLVKENLIEAAIKTGCEALHPGVGFLSENAAFARAVTEAGLVFIGPASEVIALLGDKVKARETAKRFGLPITPGTEGAVSSVEEARKAVEMLGLPVIIKAAAGGGGKGMRIVRAESEIASNLQIAIAEAQANFADGRVFIERYVENPRHVELQILSDGVGNVAVLGERDCSVQRNHQKLIEESPSTAVNDEMRRVMKEGAVGMFRELHYTGAGTIEFLVEAERNQFYFMEVNARVQVEHPVSELVSGVDIIREQILACTSAAMDITADTIRLNGAAIECRINALSPGKISALEVPGGPGVRFDSFLYTGCMVPPYYDSLVAKLIVHSPTRERAIERMNRALGELCIEGIVTNRDEQMNIINHPVFRSGKFGTSFIEEEMGR